MRKLLLGLVLMASLSGCSTIQDMYNDTPAGIAIAQSGMETATHWADMYISWDVCGKTTKKLCRTPEMTLKVIAAQAIAGNAVNTAFQIKSQDALTAAITALKALTTLTDPIAFQATIVK